MAEASFTVDYIMSLKVDALKDELEKRNLSKTGNKIDMQERLKEWLTLNARNTNISGVSTSDDFFDDYTEFKKFITESLAELKQSFEGLKQGKSSSQYLSEKNQGELIEIINGKDEMIKSLKEEIHFLRDRNFHNTQTFDTYALKETISLLKNELDQKQLIIERLISKESCSLTAKSIKQDKGKSHDQDDRKNDDEPNIEKNSQKIDKSVVIIGDSLLGGVNENGIRKASKNNNIKVKCHRGATTEDIVDHINPVVRKKPDIIIIHGGTNDLTNNVNTEENLERIICKVKNESPNTKIVVSSAIIRKDKPNLEKAVEELNKNFSVVCSKHNIDIITHGNIKLSNLTEKKLHLNKGGSSILVKNFANFLNSL